jgi:hypothetical protein
LRACWTKALRRLENRSQQSSGEADAFALKVGTGFAPQPECVVVATEVHADFLQDGVGHRLDARQPLLVEEFVDRDLALDAGDDGMDWLGLALPPRPPSPCPLRGHRGRVTNGQGSVPSANQDFGDAAPKPAPIARAPKPISRTFRPVRPNVRERILFSRPSASPRDCS